MATLYATGYVHDLIDKDQTFKDFVWSCAKAFGACINMRDDLNGPINIDKLCETNNYYLDMIKENEDLFQHLLNMTEEEKEAYGLNQINENIIATYDYITKIKTEVARVKSTLDQVKNWKPPTEDHQKLKNFMYNQLITSISNADIAYWENKIKDLQNTSPKLVWGENLKSISESINYYRERHVKEVERSIKNKEWLTKLVESIGDPNQK